MNYKNWVNQIPTWTENSFLIWFIGGILWSQLSKIVLEYNFKMWLSKGNLSWVIKSSFWKWQWNVRRVLWATFQVMQESSFCRWRWRGRGFKPFPPSIISFPDAIHINWAFSIESDESEIRSFSGIDKSHSNQIKNRTKKWKKLV